MSRNHIEDLDSAIQVVAAITTSKLFFPSGFVKANDKDTPKSKQRVSLMEKSREYLTRYLRTVVPYVQNEREFTAFLNPTVLHEINSKVHFISGATPVAVISQYLTKHERFPEDTHKVIRDRSLDKFIESIESIRAENIIFGYLE